ncbi:uncharacterized protein LOC141619698 [Silene latifolia]|uniref:uncharacterized protein LOC141619698 n=1 Tax=Silene latifolia TaxID=37657 RepID=UPI003D77C991
MGCFTTCFSNCNPSRRRRRRRSLKPCQHHPSLLHHLQNYQSVEDFKVPQLIQQEQEEPDSKDEKQEQQEQGQEGEENAENAINILHNSIDEKNEKSNRSGRKKVTFDLNVKFYENLTKDEEEIEEINEENRKNGEKQVTVCECGSDSSSSSLFSYPVNHRYQNSRDSDDEFDDILSSDDEYEDADDYDEEDEDNDDGVKDEQSSESLFSLSLDSRKHKLGTVGGDKEVNSPLQVKNVDVNVSECRFDRGKYVDSVLNPVENLTQWKDIKARSRRVMSKDEPTKENVNSVQDFSFPVKNEMLQGKKEIAVDTSLSTWLVGSEKDGFQRSDSRNSSVSVGNGNGNGNSQSDRKKPVTVVTPNKFEDRPILGALTVEEIRQMSASSTPKKSPGRSPDDMPIIGSVGSYWSRTGQTTDSGGSSVKSTKSRYRESAEVIWDSTPFEARLEKALEKEANSEGVFAV